MKRLQAEAYTAQPSPLTERMVFAEQECDEGWARTYRQVEDEVEADTSQTLN